MNIKIKSIHFDADKKLETFIENKVSKLEKYYDGIHSAEVYLRLDKNNEIGNKITEIKLDIPGVDVFAKKQSKSFEEATAEVVDALKKQLLRDKARYRNN